MSLGGICRLIFAVKDMNAEVEKIKTYFCAKEKSHGYMEKEKMRYTIVTLGKWDIEVIEGTEQDSFVNKFIERKGEGIYALTVGVDNLQNDAGDLIKNGVAFLSKEPVNTPEGTIMMMHPQNMFGLIVELTEIKD